MSDAVSTFPSDPQRFAGLVDDARQRLDGASPEEILGWAIDHFTGRRIALCTSLQMQGMVLLDMAWRIDPWIKVFTIDTGRLPAETYKLIDEVRSQYGIQIEVIFPDNQEVSELVTQNGVNCFYDSVDLRLRCCEIRKVRPLARRLETVDAWISGLHRGQSATRASVQEIELDTVHGGIVKLNPLAGWTDDMVKEYTARYNVPQNTLYEKGYTSIGCAPCTRAIEPGEDARAGRWWWETGEKECGIHYEMMVNERGEPVVITKPGAAPPRADA